MRSSVLQTLLIAFVLIAGWTLFNIYQDMRTVPGGINRNNIADYSRQYLPVYKPGTSSMYGNRLPVYSPSQQKSYNPSRRIIQSGQAGLFSKSVFDQSETPGIAGTNNIPMFQEPSFSGVNRRPSLSGNSAGSGFSQPALFALNRKSTGIFERRNQSEAPDGPFVTMPGDNKRYKAFGDPDDDDPFDSEGGSENPLAYNDLPVGDGYWVLLFLIITYALFKSVKVTRVLNLKTR